MNLKSGFGKAGVGFCVSPTWSLNNMSDFHQLCLEFWPRPSGTINHYMSAHCSCHCASWAGTKKCNNWREISSSKLQCPTVHPNTHPHLPPPTSKLPFVDICPTDMVHMHLCDMDINSLHIHSSYSIWLFTQHPSCLGHINNSKV